MTPAWAAARAAAEELIHRYADAVRRRDAAAAAELFLADGVFEIHDEPPGGEARLRARLSGRAEIQTYVERSIAAGPVAPCIANFTFDLAQGGDEARARCLMTAILWPDGARLVGAYDDRLARTPDGWRFARRRYAILGRFP
ncbi:MAG: hypothetical protein KatS3mg124_1208 [Porticoccaceae bacterium]|nr:MAG: hypothetical protein KatS3mg124_1208 [Porticoccaceae bacterium]